MRLDKKQTLTLVAFCLVSLYLTAYAVTAHSVTARYVYEEADGKTWWRTTPNGSLFPWPREPGMLQALSKMDETDLFIYRYLIKPWVLVALAILAWIGTGLYLHKVLARDKSGALIRQ